MNNCNEYGNAITFYAKLTGADSKEGCSGFSGEPVGCEEYNRVSARVGAVTIMSRVTKIL